MSYKDNLLRQLDDGYATFKKTFAGLSDAQMTRAWLAKWCVRDILAHAAGWHREMGDSLLRMARGERPTPEGVDYSDDAAWNERFAAAKRSFSPTRMVADLDASFATFRAAVAALPDERFEPGKTADRMIHTTGINHYLEHGDQIKKWRQSL